MARRIDPLIASAVATLLVIGGIVGAESSQWVGRTFPGFLILGNGVVASAGLDQWPVTRRGEIFQHEVVAYAGHPLKDPHDLANYVSRLPPGTPVVYTFRSGDQTFERKIATRRFSEFDALLLFGSLALTGLAFCGTALVILYLRRESRLAVGTVPMLWTCGLYALTALDLYGPYRLFRVHVFCETLCFATILHMALVFPKPAGISLRRPWLVWLPYVFAVPLVVAAELTLYDPAAYVRTHLTASCALGISFVILALSQLTRYLRSPSFETRQRIKAVAFGALALVPTAALSLFSVATGGGGSQNAAAFTVFAFPLSIGYAVLRQNLLDVDEMVRRSLNYALLTVTVIVLCWSSIVAVEIVFHTALKDNRGLFAVAFSILCVAVILPLRDHLQSAVDRLFFRIAYDYRQILEKTSAALASVADLDVIVNQICSVVKDTLGPEWLAVYLRRPESDTLEPHGQQAPNRPELVYALDPWQVDDGVFDIAQDELAVRFVVNARLVAVLLLGRRMSGSLYGGDDRRLLETLAHQGAVAIENALTLEQLRDFNRSLESKVTERTCDLANALTELRTTQDQLIHREKMASIGQFVAGLAHEINNPLNFIQGNLYYLRECVEGIVEVLSKYEAEAFENFPDLQIRFKQAREQSMLDDLLKDMPASFDGCVAGIERTTSLVKDLRVFARKERPEPALLSVHEALDSTLNLLRGCLKSIRVEKEYSEVPLVECLAGQIQQVFMNLLANAADAVGSQGTIWIRTLWPEPKKIVIEIEDNGCGIEREILGRIFDPFFTTKDVGKGTGLGLSISYGIVSRHGGRIEVQSEVDRGTCFRVELPVAVETRS